MNRREHEDWQEIWGDPQHGDWDLDDMEAFLLPEVWERLNDYMTDALDSWHNARGMPQSVPFGLLREINEWLRSQGIETKAWWAELYGR